MLMLNLSFDSKKSEVIKGERFIGWSAIEPKTPRQQLKNYVMENKNYVIHN